MIERYCDALVIGTDLSGLITAAFLARRGLTVHVLDLDPYARNAKEPDPFCVAHLHSKLFRSILGRLNIPENDIQSLSGQESPLQLIFPKKRIDISANPILFYEELEREFPHHHEELKMFYESLARIKHEVEMQQFYSLILPTTFRERRKLMKFVRAHGLDKHLHDLPLPLKQVPELASFIMAQLKLVTYVHNENPFAFQVAELLNPSEGEIFSVRGGHQQLKRLFIERVEHHEGAYRPEAQIENILYRDGIFEGVSLSGLEGNILAKYVIWNTHLKKLGEYLPKLWRFRGLSKAIQKIKPTAHWFTTNFELPAQFIPPMMKENLILIQDPDKDLRGENFLYVQLKLKDSFTAKLSVSYLQEPAALDFDESAFLSLHQKIKLMLLELMPFAGDNLVNTFPLSEKTENDETLFPLEENDFEIFKESAQQNAIYDFKAKSFSDLFPLTYKTAAPNLFLTAPEIMGSLGYEGKFMLGLKVTDLIWEDVKKEKKWAMKNERRIA